MVGNRAITGVATRGIVATAALTLAFCAGQGATAYAAAIDEQEPNNTYADATPIAMNKSVWGVISSSSAAFTTGASEYASGDQDFYKIDIPENGTVRFKLLNDVVGKGMSSLDFYLINKYRECVKEIEVDVSTLRPHISEIPLKRGAYYLRAVSYGYVNPYHIKLTYVVGGTNVTKLTSAKKSFSASWVKKSGAASYQVRYTPKSTYKLYGWDKAVKSTVSKKSSSKKISGLKSKLTYYVQVRVAKKIDGETYYSSWTGKKAITTK